MNIERSWKLYEIFVAFLEKKIFLVIAKLDEASFGRLKWRSRLQFFKCCTTTEKEK
jgi:hypothetical protein